MKDILITGGSDGIGLAVARLLAAEGARLTLVARDAAKLREAITKLPGNAHHFIAADLSIPNDIEMLARRLSAKHYDVLINNAGLGRYGRFTGLPLADQLRMMRLNMESIVVLSHAYLSQAQPGNALVNTASFLAYAPLPGAAVYSATKAFVATLSELLWWEYRKKGVYVLAFNPGVITTRFHASAGGSVARFPRVLLQSPEAAARELLAALRKRTAPRVITGLATRAMVRLQRLVSRKTAINMMGTSSPIAENLTERSG
ncbi:MAG: SDR family NAD(P)-dependent oxidoreductase [Gemmatimonadota bacterium]